MRHGARFRSRPRIAAASANAGIKPLQKRARECRRGCRAELLRDAGIQQRISVLDRGLTNQRETLRLTVVARRRFREEQTWPASAPSRPSRRRNRRWHGLAVREHRLLLTGTARAACRQSRAPCNAGSGDDVRSVHRRAANGARTCGTPPGMVAASKGVAAADLYPRITISGVLGLLAGRGVSSARRSRWA